MKARGFLKKYELSDLRLRVHELEQRLEAHIAASTLAQDIRRVFGHRVSGPGPPQVEEDSTIEQNTAVSIAGITILKHGDGHMIHLQIHIKPIPTE